MNFIICDYQDALDNDYTIAINELKRILGDHINISIFPFEDKDSFIDKMKDADGLITGFLPIDDTLLSKLPKLSCVSISASGYGNVNIEHAKKHNVAICHIYEYCTQEVAEHTLSFILALTKQLKSYTHMIDAEQTYQYHKLPPVLPLFKQTLAIFGFGKIGQAVAKRAQAFGMQVIAYDPWISPEIAQSMNVKLVTVDEALAQATIVSNHMLLTNETENFFNMDTFQKMTQRPFFINVGRGAQVNEADLASALDQGLLAGAGLDVLESENPVLTNHPLCHRNNVILTPHSAFYSTESLKKLQLISASNLAYTLLGDTTKVSRRIV